MTEQEQEQVDAAIERIESRFGKEWGLRAFPGDTFTICRAASFVSLGTVKLYVYIKKGSELMSFAKGTENELAREIVR